MHLYSHCRVMRVNEPRIAFPSFVLAPARLAHRRGTRPALWHDEFWSMTGTSKSRNDRHRNLRFCLYHIFVAPVRHIIEDKHLEKSFGHIGNRCEGVFNNDCIQRRSRIDLSEVRSWIESNDHPEMSKYNNGVLWFTEMQRNSTTQWATKQEDFLLV